MCFDDIFFIIKSNERRCYNKNSKGLTYYKPLKGGQEMKRIALMFALFFAVALIFPAEAPAPIAQCGDGVVNQVGEICDGADDAACPGECKDDCTCPECDDGILDPGEECDPSSDPTGCPEALVDAPAQRCAVQSLAR